MDYYILYITGWLEKTEFHAATGLPRHAAKAVSPMFFWLTQSNAQKGRSVFKPECFYFKNENQKGEIVSKNLPPGYEEYDHFTAVFLKKEEDAILSRVELGGGDFSNFCFNTKFPSTLGSKWINKFGRRADNNLNHVSLYCYKVEDKVYDETFNLLARHTMCSLMIKYTHSVVTRYANATTKGNAKQVSSGALVRTQSTLTNTHADLLNEHGSIEQRLCDILTEVHSSVS